MLGMLDSFLNDKRKQVIEHYLSSVLGIGFLFAFGLAAGIGTLTIKGPGEIVKISGRLQTLNLISDGHFEFTVKNQPKTFIVSGLREADHNLLARVEKIGTEFQFSVTKILLENGDARIPVLSLASPTNVYLAESDLGEQIKKDRIVLILLSLSAFGGGIWFFRNLRQSILRDEDVNRPIDSITAWIANHPHQAFGELASVLLFLLLSVMFGGTAGFAGAILYYAGFFFWFRRNPNRFAWLKQIAEKDSAHRLNQMNRPTTTGPKYLQAIELLIKSEKVNVKDNLGRTPLHIVVEADLTEAIGALIKAGADPNVQNAKGDTPLILAARAGRLGAVMKLVEAGAVVKTENLEKETALTIAKNGKHKGISDYLSRTAAQQELKEKKAAEAAALEAARAARTASKGSSGSDGNS